jgi:hypothetical protein
MLQSARGGSALTAGVSYRLPAGAAPVVSCGTPSLGALMRDIKLYWNDLDDDLRDLVRHVFNVRQVGDEVLVSM